MSFLLDTHVILWWWADPERLSERVVALLGESGNAIHVSPVSAYETLCKSRLGKLELPQEIIEDFSQCIREEGWQTLDLKMRHASLAGNLSSDHRDLFDRLLAAQAISESFQLVTADSAMAGFSGLERYW